MIAQQWASINGVRTPGLMTITGLERVQRWKMNEGTAQTGATIRYLGPGACTPTIVFKLLNPQHYDDWIKFRDVVDEAGKTKLRVICPQTAEVGITDFVLTKRASIKVESDGSRTVTIELTEARMPQPVRPLPPKPPPPDSTTHGDAPPTPVTEKQKRIAGKAGALRDNIEKIRGGQ